MTDHERIIWCVIAMLAIMSPGLIVIWDGIQQRRRDAEELVSGMSPGQVKAIIDAASRLGR